MMLRVRFAAVAWLVLGAAVVACAGLEGGRVDARSAGQPQTAVMRGRITAREGTPVAGAYVEPRSMDRPRARIPDVGNVSGADGRYEWTLPAGAYEISVAAEGFRRVTKPVTLLGGQATTLDFTLIRSP